MKFTEEQIRKGLDEAYKEAGHNAYFGEGFRAGIEFTQNHTEEQVKHPSNKSPLRGSDPNMDTEYSMTVQVFVNGLYFKAYADLDNKAWYVNYGGPKIGFSFTKKCDISYWVYENN